MARWHRVLILIIGLSLMAVWPARWAVQGLPDGVLAVEGGGAWPFHLLAEATVAALCLWGTMRFAAFGGWLALGTLVYSSINGLSYGAYGDLWHVGIAVAKFAAAAVLTAALARRFAQAGGRVAPRWPGALLALVGLGMIGFWSMQVAVAGIMKDGLWTAEGHAYLIFHLTAEGLAGVMALVGGVGLLLRRRSMIGTALLGAGGVFYAAVNSIGWAVLNDAALALIFVVSSLAAVAAAAGLWGTAGGQAVVDHRAA